MHYFAYGSNMSLRRLTARTPSARVVSVARLTGHRLAFHKVGQGCGSAKCDIEYTGDESSHVFGVVFRLDPAEKPVLDRIEGVGMGYEEKRVSVTTHEGREIEAWAYYATNTDPNIVPFDWYLKHVLTGAREHELPADYIRRIEATYAIPDPDTERAGRELAIYHPVP